MTDKEIVDAANALARRFYRCLGYEAPAGHRFDQAGHPQEAQMWRLAEIAFEEIDKTDVDAALAEVEAEEEAELDQGRPADPEDTEA